jgi:hypothetical protein
MIFDDIRKEINDNKEPMKHLVLIKTERETQTDYDRFCRTEEKVSESNLCNDIDDVVHMVALSIWNHVIRTAKVIEYCPEDGSPVFEDDKEYHDLFKRIVDLLSDEDNKDVNERGNIVIDFKDWHISINKAKDKFGLINGYESKGKVVVFGEYKYRGSF